ncbi:5962_t:CDS:2 [Racocetra fulgida]|uniref:non-specific serine/threonine protein kinase n=1 Tax=Racocetra fulgida TaxID=60492 RepID=A0A9N9F0Z3_9GLOM|nr:5962_t:CDS:2 [Racocetra fulgida]
MRVSEQRYVPKRKAREPYSKQELVGRGAYGSVYKGINNNTNQVVAIKVLNLDTEEDDVGDIIKEINLLSLLNSESQNITRYYGSFLHGTKLWIIMEYAAGITVYEITTGNPPYHDQSAMRAIQLIPKNRPATLEGPYSAPLKEFVAICLNEISEDRPTADELMKTKFIKSSSKHPNGILRDLIARFEQWKQTTGYRQSFSDPYGTPSSDSYDFEDGQKEEEDAWVFDVRSLHNSGSDQLSPVIEDEEHMGLTIDNKLKTQENEDVDRTILPKDNTVRYGRILADGLLSPSTPIFQRKYSESHHPLLQLFQNEEKTQLDNMSKESSPAGSFRNPTITIPPMNIMSLMPRMEDSPSISMDMNIKLNDDGLENNSFDRKSKSSLSTSDLSSTDSTFTRIDTPTSIEIVVPTGSEFGGNLGVGIPRQRATSVSHVLRPSKSKDTSTSTHLLPPSPSTAKFLNNSSLPSQGSPTRPIFPSQSSIILNTGPELRPLKMDNYRGTSEVYEDLTKTTDDLLQWMTLLEAGINQLMTRF